MALSALILAGGQGSRMGGRNKGLMLYRGMAFVDCVISRLGIPAENIAVSANENLAEYGERVPLVFCDPPGYRRFGPLAALAGAAQTELGHAQWLLVVPCDTLHLPQDLGRRFQAAAQTSPECRAFFAATEKRSHYGVMFIRGALLGTAAGYLNQGGRSIRGWLEAQQARPLMFPCEEAFRNYNTLQDMES